MLNRWKLAERGPEVVQVWEATGELPPLKGNSWAKPLLKSDFGADVESGWLWFTQQVEGASRDTPEPKPIEEPAPVKPPIHDAGESMRGASPQKPEAQAKKKGWRRYFGG